MISGLSVHAAPDLPVAALKPPGCAVCGQAMGVDQDLCVLRLREKNAVWLAHRRCTDSHFDIEPL